MRFESLDRETKRVVNRHNLSLQGIVALGTLGVSTEGNQKGEQNKNTKGRIPEQIDRKLKFKNVEDTHRENVYVCVCVCA